MPPIRFKGRLWVVLLVVFSAIGQWLPVAQHSRQAVFSLKAAGGYRDHGHEKQDPVFKLYSAGPSKQTDTTQKRHKRLLMCKVWQPATNFTFIKRYRLIPAVTDYSSPHILQRTALVFSLRGPPAVA
jgi:hypothetical protein